MRLIGLSKERLRNANDHLKSFAAEPIHANALVEFPNS
jgi:hypothetical protein